MTSGRGRQVKLFCCVVGAAQLGLSFGMAALGAELASPSTPPDPPAFGTGSASTMVGPTDIVEFRHLAAYHEPDWVTRDFVEKGLLPPIDHRLPKEPLVFKTGDMPDGVGQYGDVLRHVTGGRPQGWNFMAGQSQGWGGVDIGTMECLTRTGPLYRVRAADLEPLPNLAKSWDWSADGHKLTMHLVEGARWSDGVPFTSEDVMFYWQDNVLDPNVTPLGGTAQETFGPRTTLRAIDDYTIQWTFADAFPTQYLYEMAYPNFCPGPAHVFKPLHPKYNPHATYDSYWNAVPAASMNIPVMGAWVPVTYRPDDILVMRRNPYYWKVDEAGNQLPYLDEVQYRLSTWQARDIDTAAGLADFSNLSNTENFVEVLKHAADPASPVTFNFGPRTIAYSVYMNLSANGWGQPDARAQAVRELNRNLDFREAVSTAIDRQKLGAALVKGPFTAEFPGGILAASAYYDKASTVYYPPSIETAKAYLGKAGLVDTDDDGIVNWPAGTLNGDNVDIVLVAFAGSNVDTTLAEGVIADLDSVGLHVALQRVDQVQRAALAEAGNFDWLIDQNGPEQISVIQGTQQLAPIGPDVFGSHHAGPDGTLDLLPFERQLVDVVKAFIATNDPETRISLMRTYQHIYTENIYEVGLTQYPGAMVISKRFSNVAPDVPIFDFNWAEDSIIRERLFVSRAKQQDYELFPSCLPGKPGSLGPEC
jgi:peptide/nickel transport system substrate-binding protein